MYRKSEFLGEQDNDPLNNTDCASLAPLPSTGPTTSPNPNLTPLAPGKVARATEFQVFTSAPSSTQAGTGIECDVFGRPSGDGIIDSTDVGQVRRFQLGFDSIMASEFQRADCSLLDTLGDGRIDALDVGQAQRYQLGLDSLRAVGGPATAATTRPAESSAKDGKTAASKRSVRVIAEKAAPGQTAQVAIEADTIGSESIYGFTLGYDRAVLTYVPGSVRIGSGATRQDGGNCNVLENADTAGQIGFSIDCNNSAITAGNSRQLVTMQFVVSAKASSGTTSFIFNDASSRRSVSSNPAAGAIQSVPTNFTGGSLTILPRVKGAGRVSSANGRGLSGATVYLTDDSGVKLKARTNSFGYYQIAGLSAGKTYTVTAAHKRYQFTPQVITAGEAMESPDFTAQS